VARQTLDLIPRNTNLHPYELPFRESLGTALVRMGAHEQALAELDIALAQALSEFPPTHIELYGIRGNRGLALAGLKRYPEARANLEAAYDIAEKTYGPSAKDTQTIARDLLQLATTEGNQAEAERWRAKLPPE
jgi:serine/threonine-protein kinase